jgi:hypothetical protein
MNNSPPVPSKEVGQFKAYLSGAVPTLWIGLKLSPQILDRAEMVHAKIRHTHDCGLKWSYV